jgi:hypothetical protein
MLLAPLREKKNGAAEAAPNLSESKRLLHDLDQALGLCTVAEAENK